MPRKKAQKDRITYSLNGHYRVRVRLAQPLFPEGPIDARATGANFKEVVHEVLRTLLPQGVKVSLGNIRVPVIDVGKTLRPAVDWDIQWGVTLTEGTLFPGFNGQAADPDPNRGYIRACIESARTFLNERRCD